MMMMQPVAADIATNDGATADGSITGDDIRTGIQDTDTGADAVRVRSGGSIGTWVPQDLGDCAADGSMSLLLDVIGNVGGGDGSFPRAGDYVYFRLVNAAGDTVTTYFWNECLAQPLPTAPPSVEDVLAAADLPRLEPRTNPHGAGTVGLQNWFWYEGPTEVPVSVTLDGWTATATAEAVGWEWDVGDATLTANVPGSEADPAARHTFIRQGTRTLTQTTTWQAALIISGFGVTVTAPLGSVDVTGPPRPYDVIEYEAVIVG